MESSHRGFAGNRRDPQRQGAAGPPGGRVDGFARAATDPAGRRACAPPGPAQKHPAAAGAPSRADGRAPQGPPFAAEAVWPTCDVDFDIGLPQELRTTAVPTIFGKSGTKRPPANPSAAVCSGGAAGFAAAWGRRADDILADGVVLGFTGVLTRRMEAPASGADRCAAVAGRRRSPPDGELTRPAAGAANGLPEGADRAVRPPTRCRNSTKRTSDGKSATGE